MLPAVPVLSACTHAIVPSLAATSCMSLAPSRSLPMWRRVQPSRQSPKSSEYVTLPATGNVILWYGTPVAVRSAPAGAAVAPRAATAAAAARVPDRRARGIRRDTSGTDRVIGGTSGPVDGPSGPGSARPGGGAILGYPSVT